ncbi:nucleotidyltransferase family protein [Luteimonas gilva]|uniref:Nucleotidyltransferase family protein n=1 Tax=Luteimonas gilva TaxID=2572684 RepID=A0A4U5JRL2_9GAMM|nr:nucleotidyltransferase family protein [Luteimonas gilva]
MLAAGGSRRLGRPKQLLTRGGETLAHRAARLAAQTSPRRLLVISGAFREEVEKALADLDGESVFNENWESGLAGSLRSAAAALADHDGPVLIVGCDQPALEGAHLAQLLAGAANTGCAATSHGGSPGIPAIVPVAMLREADALSGDRGLGARLRGLPQERVWMLRAAELEFDIDDEDDLRIAVDRGLIDA